MAAPFAPSPLKFGYYYDEDTDTPLVDEPLLFGGETHVLLFGVNGAGKSTRILIENLVTMCDRSAVVFDMKGELAAQTLRARLLAGAAKLINPYDLHGMGSDGFNPLATLDPADDEFFDKAKDLTFAMIESEAGDKDQYFSRSARGWFCGGIMWEVIAARREGRPASLLRAREWCLQPDAWLLLPDGKNKIQTAGVTVNAKQMVAEGGQSASGASSSEGENYSQTGVPFRLPQELMNMRRGTGLIWLQGMGDQSIPFAAPNWWQRAAIAHLVDASPYHAALSGAATGDRQPVDRQLVNRAGASAIAAPGLALAFAVGCVLAVLMMIGGGNTHTPLHPALPPIHQPPMRR